MAEGSSGEGDLFRLWLEGTRAFLNADAEAGGLWPRCQELFAAWSRFASDLGVAEGRAGDGAGPFDPAGWMRAEGDGGMADLWRWFEGPDLAIGFESFRRSLRESREWMAYATAVENMRRVTAEGWMRAFRRFVDALSQRMDEARKAGGDTPDWRAMQVLWREIADQELATMQRSETFLAAQRDLIREQIAVRRLLRGRVEEMARLIGLPTRAELDDLHRVVDGLRREVEALRRRMPQGGGER